MKIIFSGLTRDVEREYGTIENKDCYALFYNKAIYRFIYNVLSKNDFDRMLSDFKLLKFENCDFEETDGGENKSIRFYRDEKEIEPVGYFEGDGEHETISIDYEYDWLHSVSLEAKNEVISVNCSSYDDFINMTEGKEILKVLSEVK